MTESCSFRDRVAETIRKHRMLGTGKSVLVGVSGGADSVSLVRVLADFGEDLVSRLAIAHVNHGWRGEESDRDQRFVETLAERLGLKVFVQRSVAKVDGAGLENIAREERRDFFKAIAGREGFERIAVAHNREDRCETFFLNLMRGTGRDGLLSMPPVSGPVIRPFIESSRSEIEEYLKEIDQVWRTDTTNLDTRFSRNKIRHDVFPKLQEEFNPRLTAALSRTIDILQREEEWMEQAVTAWIETHGSNDGADLVIEFSGLESEPAGFVRRVLREALRMAGSPMRDIGFDHIERVRSLLQAEKSGRVIELPGSIGVERNFETLRFFVEDAGCPEYEYELPIPGAIDVPEIGAVFKARLVQMRASETCKPNGDRVFVDGESLGRYVKIRNWKSGDCYSPYGLSTSKLKTLFQKGRIPRRNRRQWPVVVANSSIVWVASFPVSRDFVPTRRSRRIVEFEASHILR